MATSVWPEIRSATCFRGRVLVIDEYEWPSLDRSDLDTILDSWLREMPMDVRETVIAGCRQPGLDDREIADLIALDLVSATAAKPWSCDCRYVEEVWPNGRIEQGPLRDISDDGCWMRAGLWVGSLYGQASYAAHWWLGAITGIAFNDGRILDASHPVRMPCGLAGETIPNLTSADDLGGPTPPGPADRPHHAGTQWPLA